MKVLAYIIMSLLTSCSALAQAGSPPPQSQIANSLVRVRVYLPDAARGFYRGTRFDWSGVIADLQYAGHSYYGEWFTQTDPTVSDFIYRGAEIVAGPCSAITGPVEEFTAQGYDEAKAGGMFLKIGVGVLRKADDTPYDPYRLYEIVDGGKWSVKKSKAALEFTQELHHPSSGYGYVYRKKISLTAGKPEMLIEHSLRNVGTRAIQTSVYDHNFLVLDRQPTDAGFTITLPFTISSDHPPERELAELYKNQIVFLKTLAGEQRVYTSIAGFGKTSDDYKIRIENAKVKAGMVISGDRPLARMSLWSIRSVLAVEPFIDISVAPESQTTWNYHYEYYTSGAPSSAT
jgi:hypothetical protein